MLPMKVNMDGGNTSLSLKQKLKKTEDRGKKRHFTAL